MSKLKELVEGAYLVCTPCGKEYGSKPDRKGTSTYHMGTCDICQRGPIPVTEFRDFGYERKLRPREQYTGKHLKGTDE